MQKRDQVLHPRSSSAAINWAEREQIRIFSQEGVLLRIISQEGVLLLGSLIVYEVLRRGGKVMMSPCSKGCIIGPSSSNLLMHAWLIQHVDSTWASFTG